MKTVLREFIEIIKDKRKESDISNTLLRFCQVEAEKLLEKEKQQILYAVNSQRQIGWDEKGEDYYRSTFGESN